MQFQLRPDITSIHNEETGKVTEVNSDLAARAYFSGGSIDLGLLPPAVRWISVDGLGIILERPPQKRKILYKRESFDVCIPWTIWGIRLHNNRRVKSSYLFARPYPLASPTDELFAFPLPNMSNSSEIALPSVIEGAIGESLLPMIDIYWNKGFTGVFNEMLIEKTMVPDEWIPSINEGVGKYLTFLGEHDLESITFAPLKVAQVPTLDDLCMILDPSLQVEGPQSVMEYLEDVVTRAQQMAAF